MRRRFNILDLPDLPFENVYGYLEFEDLIELASCSNRLKSIIQTMEQKQKKLTILRFGNPLIENTDVVRRISLSDESQGQTRKELRMSFAVFTTERQLYWFKYFKDLFNCRIEIRLKFPQNISSLKPLLVDTNLLHVADMITIYLGHASAKHLNYLLNTLQAEKLDITFGNPPTLKLGRIVLRSRCLTLRNARFWTLRDVWKLIRIRGGSCRQLELRGIKECCSRDINQFIQNWLDSDNTTFGVLDFDVRIFRDSDEPLLLGIPSLPGSKKRGKAAEYYNHCTLYQNGHDIRRKDGLLATFVEKSTGQTSKRFSFTVWYCFDPNAPARNN